MLSLEGDLASRLAPGAQVFSMLGQPVLVHGARPAQHQVHSSGPWDDPSREWSTMPVSSRRPRRRRSWWCHTPLIDPGYPNPCETSGVQMRPGCAQLLAMVPGMSPSGRCVRGISSVVLCHRNLAGTRAQRRVDDLHHHAPVALSDSLHNLGSQHSGHRSLCRAPERIQAERQKPGGSPLSRRGDHTDHNDQATQSSR